jgi:outer membrane protein, heavy metal efflux system
MPARSAKPVPRAGFSPLLSLTSLRRRRVRAAASLCIVSASVLSGLSAAGAEPGGTAAAESGGAVPLLQVVSNAPALAAARQRISAAQTRFDSAGRLRDPEVEAMGARASMPDENRTMWELTLRQPLPKRGERAADRDRARAVVSMAEADYAAMAGEMAANVAMALAEIEGIHARIGLLETQLARFESVLQAVENRLATGATGRIGDRLTLQSRIAAMQLMIEEERRMAEDAADAARGRLGLSPGIALPAFAAVAPTEISPDDAALLRLAAARSAEADAMVKMARASANPMTAVGLRLEREQTRIGNGDTIGLAFMSEIPWRSRGYARADARAAEADRAAARADADAARFRIATTLSRVERADRLAATTRRLAGETRGRLETELDAFIRAAGVTGTGGMAAEASVLQAVEILEKTTEAELQVIQAETAARAARAKLWRYAPADRLLQLSRL